MFKRTKVTARIEMNVDVFGVHKTGHYVYFRQQPGGPLCRMTPEHYKEYSRSRGHNRDKAFWRYVEFLEKERSII